jgi:hypothetical protein
MKRVKEGDDERRYQAVYHTDRSAKGEAAKNGRLQGLLSDNECSDL